MKDVNVEERVYYRPTAAWGPKVKPQRARSPSPQPGWRLSSATHDSSFNNPFVDGFGHRGSDSLTARCKNRSSQRNATSTSATRDRTPTRSSSRARSRRGGRDDAASQSGRGAYSSRSSGGLRGADAGWGGLSSSSFDAGGAPAGGIDDSGVAHDKYFPDPARGVAASDASRRGRVAKQHRAWTSPDSRTGSPFSGITSAIANLQLQQRQDRRRHDPYAQQQQQEEDFQQQQEDFRQQQEFRQQQQQQRSHGGSRRGRDRGAHDDGHADPNPALLRALEESNRTIAALRNELHELREVVMGSGAHQRSSSSPSSSLSPRSSSSSAAATARQQRQRRGEEDPEHQEAIARLQTAFRQLQSHGAAAAAAGDNPHAIPEEPWRHGGAGGGASTRRSERAASPVVAFVGSGSGAGCEQRGSPEGGSFHFEPRAGRSPSPVRRSAAVASQAGGRGHGKAHHSRQQRAAPWRPVPFGPGPDVHVIAHSPGHPGGKIAHLQDEIPKAYEAVIGIRKELEKLT